MADRSHDAWVQWLTCKLCGRRLNSSNGLHVHVSRLHHMSAMDYYLLYLDVLVHRIVVHTKPVEVVEGMSACWEWTGLRSKRGYGRMRVAGASTDAAHRYALLTRLGSLDNAETARHRCDNPPCCNPDHLEPGSHLENVCDRNSRGRTAVGTQTRSGKLTDEDVVLIRLRAECSGESCREIAEDFPINEEAVRRVVVGNTYRHVSENFIPW